MYGPVIAVLTSKAKYRGLVLPFGNALHSKGLLLKHEAAPLKMLSATPFTKGLSLLGEGCN